MLQLRRHFGLLLVSLVSLGISLLVTKKWLPELFRAECRMTITKVSDEIVPFYEGKFRPEDYSSSAKIPDPVTMYRGRPLSPQFLGKSIRFGPTDILGFRNERVPNLADIVVIGDSHTLGYNVEHSVSWPVVLEKMLDRGSVYNMSLGGWGALQYLAMFKKAHAFRPQVIVVGIYSGNDAIDSFTFAYSSDYWREYRISENVSLDDLPDVTFPPPMSEWWDYSATDGFRMVFLPSYRHLANRRDQPAINTGYRIIERVLSEMLSISKTFGTKTFVTVFPSKEVVYSARVKRSREVDANLGQRQEFDRLIDAEQSNINQIKELVESQMPGHYIDLLSDLQSAALDNPSLYPADRDGHPSPLGHKRIAQRIFDRIALEVHTLKDGIVTATVMKGRPQYIRVDSRQCFQFDSKESLLNGKYGSEPVREESFRMIQTCESLVAEKEPDLAYEQSELIAQVPKIVLPE